MKLKWKKMMIKMGTLILLLFIQISEQKIIQLKNSLFMKLKSKQEKSFQLLQLPQQWFVVKFL